MLRTNAVLCSSHRCQRSNAPLTPSHGAGRRVAGDCNRRPGGAPDAADYLAVRGQGCLMSIPCFVQDAAGAACDAHNVKHVTKHACLSWLAAGWVGPVVEPSRTVYINTLMLTSNVYCKA